MLRLIIQTKRRYKMIVKHKDKQSLTNDHDSDVKFESDNDEEIDTAEIEEEGWEATEKMRNEKIRCWNKTHKKMDFRRKT